MPLVCVDSTCLGLNSLIHYLIYDDAVNGIDL